MNEQALKNRWVVQPGETFRLADVDPEDTGSQESKRKVKELLVEDRRRLADLQELLWAEEKHSLLVVLQATDTGGKDGAIRHVFRGVNPQGCVVTPFRVPTPQELAHDYLWRVHKAAPARGMMGIFNRSHYEDVLVVRVHNLVPKAVWKERYEQINLFERHLVENGTTIVKFFLHISKDEQRRRLQQRLDDPKKHWKFSVGDLRERELWDDYQAAFEEMVKRTSTPWAPWHVVPANRKWYRNYVVARTIIQTLESLDMKFPASREDLSQVVIPE